MNPPAQLVTIAHTLRTRGEFNDALNASVQAIYADPTDPSAWYLRALVLADLGELDQALRSCERALVLDPGHLPARSTRAALLARLAAPEACTTTATASGHNAHRATTVPTAL